MPQPPKLASPKRGFKPNRRQAISRQSPQDLVDTFPLLPDRAIPWVIAPKVDGIALGQWAQQNRSYVDDLFYQHRALLFRNFRVKDAATFEKLVQVVSEGELLAYMDRTSPRTTLPGKAGQVYTSTVYPAEGHIHMHNELSYAAQWPLKLFFCCLQPADQGGETPIADVRRVYDRIASPVRQQFQTKQWMLKRNYNQGFGLPWQEVFQTQDRATVETYCQSHQIEFEWHNDDSLAARLETRQVRPAIHLHPRTGESLWFNHMAFFHDTSLEPPMRQELLQEFGSNQLPYSTHYGDGSAIAPDIVDHIRAAYEQEKVVFPWQQGDILMLDNMAIAHGRHPYSGSRQVVVAMTEAHNI